MWGLDLGTTNTSLARWDEKEDRPRLVQLPALQRALAEDDDGRAPQVVPSATQLIEDPDLWARLSRWAPRSRSSLWGRLAYIGHPALERSEATRQRGFALTFK